MDESATVTIRKGAAEIDSGTGAASGEVSFTTGANTLTVTVEATEETAVYTILVTMAPS